VAHRFAIGRGAGEAGEGYLASAEGTVGQLMVELDVGSHDPSQNRVPGAGTIRFEL
jgi:hypothetical protein